MIPAGLILILAGLLESATFNGLDLIGWVFLFAGVGRVIQKAATK